MKRTRWQANEDGQHSGVPVDGEAGHGGEDGRAQDNDEDGIADDGPPDGEGSGEVAKVPPAEDGTGGEDPLGGESMNIEGINVPVV